MKTIAVLLDGLLVEDAARLPSADPIPAAVEYVRVLNRGGSGRLFIVTLAPTEISDDTIRDWLRVYQIPMTDLIRLEGTPSWRMEDQLLSAAGARATVLGLFVVAFPYFVEYMTSHGVPVAVFAHADPVIDYRPERGLTWAQLGRSEEDA